MRTRITPLRIVVAAIALLGAVLIVRTLAVEAPTDPPGDFAPVEVDADAAARHFAEAIRFATVSRQESAEGAARGVTRPEGDPSSEDAEAFDGFVAWVAATYPLVDEAMQLERVADYTLLYTWKGRRSDLPPTLLAAHYDVVPVARDAYRLNPMRVQAEDIAGFHGTDERMRVDSLAAGIAIYAELMPGRRALAATPGWPAVFDPDRRSRTSARGAIRRTVSIRVTRKSPDFR